MAEMGELDAVGYHGSGLRPSPFARQSRAVGAAFGEPSVSELGVSQILRLCVDVLMSHAMWLCVWQQLCFGSVKKLGNTALVSKNIGNFAEANY